MSEKNQKSENSSERKSRKSIHVMLREVDDGQDSNSASNRRQTRLIGVTALEELLLDHQAKQADKD